MARTKKTDATQKKLVENAAATQQAEHPGIDPEILDRMTDDARSLLAQEDAFAEQYGAAYELHGQIKSSSFFRKSATVAELLLIRQMRESKYYKRINVVVEEDGKKNTRRVADFADYCQLCLGVSVRKVEEDLQNLAALGEEFYEATQKMGLTYRQLRALRAMPEDERDEVKRLAEEKDYNALKDILYQQLDETEKYKKQIEKREDEIKNKDTLYEKAVKRQQEAEIKLERLSKLSPDEQARAQDEIANKALKELYLEAVQVQTQWAIYRSRARAIMDVEGFGPEVFDLVAAVTSAMCAKIAEDLDDAGVQVDFRRTIYPDVLCGQNPDYAALRGDAVSEDSPDVPANAEHAA